MKFTVDRKTWRRGKLGINSGLLLENGERCCVGFFCKALGCSDAVIFEKCYLGSLVGTEVGDKVRPYLEGVGADTPTFHEIYETNDSPDISERKREERLKALFAQENVEVEFIN
jgi:hypothetical protein